MPDRFDFGRVDLTAGESPSVARPSSETPFCVAILGDFSGRCSRGLLDAKSVGERRAILIDRDNFDDVLSSLKIELHLPTREGTPIVFHFAELEDFHPDRLFHHPALNKLREVRDGLQNTDAFRQIAEELGVAATGTQVSNSREIETAAAKAPSTSQLASGSLLDEMIEQTEARTAENRSYRKRDEVHEFARQIAAKYAVSAPDPRRPELVAAVDRAVSDVMRTILHNPDFQALEAIWRATFLLVRRLETRLRLKLYLFDISKLELEADLGSSSDLRNTGIFRLLVEKGILTPGADPWAIIVGDYRFGPSKNDVRVLAQMAKIAHWAGAPFLAEASPLLLGATSLAATPHPRDWNKVETELKGLWDELRRQPEASSVGLALPRFLLRLPYGEKTAPLEAFQFEEFPGPPIHEAYLWGNPAFAIALLLAQSFHEAGWEMRAGATSKLDGLPLHIYPADGSTETKACAEVWFTEDAVQRILDGGLIPLVSYKGQDLVKVARFQSVSEPAKGLAGRWDH